MKYPQPHEEITCDECIYKYPHRERCRKLLSKLPVWRKCSGAIRKTDNNGKEAMNEITVMRDGRPATEEELWAAVNSKPLPEYKNESPAAEERISSTPQEIGFNPCELKVFTGGDFYIPKHIKTVGHLADELEGWVKEIRGWGSDKDLTMVEIAQGKLKVILKEGIFQ